jgi:hypothetical protein
MVELTGLKGATDIKQLNGITIHLNYSCCHTFDIPIINGQPFGKNAKKQEAAITKWDECKSAEDE